MAGKVSKPSVNYRRAGILALFGRRCGACVMFRPGQAGEGRCTLVEGVIGRGDLCDRWARK